MFSHELRPLQCFRIGEKTCTHTEKLCNQLSTLVHIDTYTCGWHTQIVLSFCKLLNIYFIKLAHKAINKDRGMHLQIILVQKPLQ